MTRIKTVLLLIHYFVSVPVSLLIDSWYEESCHHLIMVMALVHLIFKAIYDIKGIIIVRLIGLFTWYLYY